jgi:hypothetical protein
VHPILEMFLGRNCKEAVSLDSDGFEAQLLESGRSWQLA